MVDWDNTGNRFIFLLHRGKLLLSVAQQSSGLGNYCNYTFPTYHSDGADFQKLGVDDDGVYFSANLYGSGNQQTNELYFANRAKLESCSPASYTDWVGLTNPDGTLSYAIVPAVQSGQGNVEYLVNAYPAGACKIILWSLVNTGNLSNVDVPTQCYSPPPAVQKGSPATINSDDSSFDQASYVNGLITVANEGSYDWGDGNGPVGIVEWYIIDPIALAVASQGAFGTPGYWLLYPSAVQNPSGNMMFVYNAVGPSIYPSIWYVNQSMTGTQALAQGQGYYYTNSEAPWGDYQSAWLNPITQNSVWITGEYANAADRWSTKFGEVTP